MSNSIWSEYKGFWLRSCLFDQYTVNGFADFEGGKHVDHNLEEHHDKVAVRIGPFEGKAAAMRFVDGITDHLEDTKSSWVVKSHINLQAERDQCHT